MYLSKLKIQNFRSLGSLDSPFEIEFNSGVTAIVGPNDSGKSTIVDAIRFALGTSDQERIWVNETDFRSGETIIKITCIFESLSNDELSAFAECLTYDTDGNKPFLVANWSIEDTGTTLKGRKFHKVEFFSGLDANGSTFSKEQKILLTSTYLRPLRDAASAMAAGRNSRLSQILKNSNEIHVGDFHDPDVLLKDQNLTLVEIGKLASKLIQEQKGLKETELEINKTLNDLSLIGEPLQGQILVTKIDALDESILKELLEKLNLSINGKGVSGLGSDNLLFMACELLLLSSERIGNKLLLIEEPEAHLHPQRQLQVMKLLQDQAKAMGVQVILTTHSPILSSVLRLNNLVLLNNSIAFSLSQKYTCLSKDDYRFLERYLDSTKANLFFAKGVLIVEGDAEAILLPTIANLIGKNFTKHGISVVNVGGVGLSRYSNIYQQKEPSNEIQIPVACITDFDVLPNCASSILGKDENSTGRKWKMVSDFTETELPDHRTKLINRTEGQKVRSFVSDYWTFEYDLALGGKPQNAEEKDYNLGLAKELFIAAKLALKEESLVEGKSNGFTLMLKSIREFSDYLHNATPKNGCSKSEVIASNVYALFSKESGTKSSKAIAAHYLSDILNKKFKVTPGASESDEDFRKRSLIKQDELRSKLPHYIVNAIDYVTSSNV